MSEDIRRHNEQVANYVRNLGMEIIEKMDDDRTIIDLERWEADEYVITINGKPVGQTLGKTDAMLVTRWLATSLKDLCEAVKQSK